MTRARILAFVVILTRCFNAPAFAQESFGLLGEIGPGNAIADAAYVRTTNPEVRGNLALTADCGFDGMNGGFADLSSQMRSTPTFGISVGSVIGGCADVEMGRIHARRIVAGVQDVQVGGDIRPGQFESDSIGSSHFSVEPEHSVSSAVSRRPRPALFRAGYLDFAPEPFRNGTTTIRLCTSHSDLLCLDGDGSAESDISASPDPTAKKNVSISLFGGMMHFAERGQPDKKDFVYRVSVRVQAPERIEIEGRADYTRTQDGGDLFDIETFRSVEAYLGGRKDVARNLSVSAFSGVSWDRDKDFDPADARLWTAAVGLRYAVPGRGYVLAAAGHHGPVGGTAFLGSVVYELSSSTNWFFDIAVPLDADRFKLRPYTVKAGVAARLKFWTF